MTRFDAVNFHLARNLQTRRGCPSRVGVRGVDEDAATVEGADDKKRSTEALEAYCVNLNQRAKDGRIDPLIGRERGDRAGAARAGAAAKNNPLFVGDAGVGKTAIVEGLARQDRARRGAGGAEGRGHLRARHGRDGGRDALPRRLRGALQGGHQGARSEPGAIVFIDELHTIVGAGAASGGAMDASNLIKPALANGQAPLHRHDDAQGVPQLHREGPGAGPPVPADRGRRADDRGDGQGAQGPASPLRGVPRRQLHRRGASRRRPSCRRATSTTAGCPTRRST